MKRGTKILSVILLVCTLLSIMPLSAMLAFASEASVETPKDATAEIKSELSAFKQGETLTFEDDGYIGIPYEVTVYYDVSNGAAVPGVGGTVAVLYVVNTNTESSTGGDVFYVAFKTIRNGKHGKGRRNVGLSVVLIRKVKNKEFRTNHNKEEDAEENDKTCHTELIAGKVADYHSGRALKLFLFHEAKLFVAVAKKAAEQGGKFIFFFHIIYLPYYLSTRTRGSTRP